MVDRDRRPSGANHPDSTSNGHEADLDGLGRGGWEDHKPVRVMIVDDLGLFRQGLARILATQSDIEVVAEINGAGAVRTARREQPDVIVLGGESSVAKIVEDVTGLLAASPASKIVVLALYDEPRRVKRLLSLGAHAYVLKSASQEELITTIRVVSRHSDRVMLSVSRQTLNILRGSPGLVLSERELEVLTLVAEGKRNSEIAAQLFIAEGTVKRHLTNIYAKLGATSRTDAVHKAVSQGHALYEATAGSAPDRRTKY